MIEARGGYGDRRRGFTRVNSTEGQEDIEQVRVIPSTSRARQHALVPANGVARGSGRDDGGVVQCGRRKVQVSGVREDGKEVLESKSVEHSAITAADRSLSAGGLRLRMCEPRVLARQSFSAPVPVSPVSGLV